MKVQSIDGAINTQYVIKSLSHDLHDDDAKLTAGYCLAIALQLTASLLACGNVHWAMT